MGEGRPDFRSESEVPTKEDSLVLFKILIQDPLLLYSFLYLKKKSLPLISKREKALQSKERKASAPDS